MKNMNAETTQDINGLISNSKTLSNQLISKDIKSVEINKSKLNNENKDKSSIVSPLMDKKFQNFVPSYIPINTLSDMSNNFNLNSNNALIFSNEIKSDKKDISKINSEEILENGLSLDEQNMPNYYDKIDNKVDIIKIEKKDDIINSIDNKKIKTLADGKIYINENNQNNKNITSNKDKKNININESGEKLPFDIQISKELFNKIEFGIDENGNPFNIKQISKDSLNKKPVALIIQKGNNVDNYLIDLQGKKISKTEDGYFNYKNNNTRVIIKDFDVQHPELRIYGTRNKDTLTINSEDKDKDNNYKNSSILFDTKILNFKRNSPIKINHIKNIKDPKTDNRKKYIINLNKNKKKIDFKSKVPIPISTNIVQYPKKKYSSNYTINRTNNILNKSLSNITSHNRSYTMSNSNKYLLRNKPENKNNINKISTTPIREIKNISCTSSRINLYNYKKNEKKGGNINSFAKTSNRKNIIHRNAQSLQNLNSSYFETDSTYIISNDFYNNNKKSINSNFSSIQNKNIRKSQSSQDVSSTISNISNKIKYIKNKINNSSNITNQSTISTNNPLVNNIYKNYNSYNSYNIMNQSNDNGTLHNRHFKCAILSKEVNDIISDYSITNNKKDIKNRLYENDNKVYKININKNNTNSFLNGHSMANLMFKKNMNNYTTDTNYFSWNDMNINNLNNNANLDNTNNKTDNFRLCGKNILNRIKSSYNRHVLQNGIINFKRRKNNTLLKINNNTSNDYKSPMITQNYTQYINSMNRKNKLYNRKNFGLLNSRNLILNSEENKSQTNVYDIIEMNKNYQYNYKYSTSNNSSSRNFNFN